ncbi:uncharacterized protein BDV14DRAFT_43590 [Aspergillus stella-maris]|uniref:uncharacterized protein n=1 Tax=Aspergillus stella-maris TaxID=1810926 RepID=UPI003CCD533A
MQCDGKQPCNRCSSYNHPCLFRERKATQTKVYSRGFVEMLESHHSLVVKALQRLYKLCANNEGFPGEPLAETSDGYPLTHAILDRLGLIKQAEDTPQATGEESEDLQYLRVLSTSTDCSGTADPSPEPVTPPDPAPVLSSPVQLSPGGPGPLKWELQSTIQSEPYHNYPHSHPHTEYRELASVPRPALETSVTLGSDTKCTTTVPSPVAGLTAPPYMYYAEGSCNPDSTDDRLQHVVSTGPSILPAISATGLPVDLVDNYALPMPDHRPIYQAPLPSGWTYPCE